MREQRSHRLRVRSGAERELLEQPLGGAAVQLTRVFLDSESRAEARQQRQAPREAHVERVDGLHAQPSRLLEQVPAARRVASQCRAGQLEGARLQ